MTARGVSVLLVDDDDGFRTALARHLRQRGLVVREADSAAGAVGMLSAGSRPDLVLLDLTLDGDTGWDLLRGDALAAAGSPPVVIISATDLEPKRREGAGIAGFLRKPFPFEALLALVDRVARYPAVVERA